MISRSQWLFVQLEVGCEILLASYIIYPAVNILIEITNIRYIEQEMRGNSYGHSQGGKPCKHLRTIFYTANLIEAVNNLTQNLHTRHFDKNILHKIQDTQVICAFRAVSAILPPYKWQLSRGDFPLPRRCGWSLRPDCSTVLFTRKLYDFKCNANAPVGVKENCTQFI